MAVESGYSQYVSATIIVMVRWSSPESNLPADLNAMIVKSARNNLFWFACSDRRQDY